MIWWKTTHYHASKMVSDQHQWCCSHTMLPPPMMNMSQPYNFIKAWHNTMLLLRYFQEKQWKVYPGSISAPWSKRTLNSTIYIYNEFESLSFFIIIIYLTFRRIRGPSCDFVYYLMKFKKWREKKTDLFLNGWFNINFQFLWTSSNVKFG